MWALARLCFHLFSITFCCCGAQVCAFLKTDQKLYPRTLICAPLTHCHSAFGDDFATPLFRKYLILLTCSLAALLQTRNALQTTQFMVKTLENHKHKLFLWYYCLAFLWRKGDVVLLLFILVSAAGESQVTFATGPAVFQPQVLEFFICDLLRSRISVQSLLFGRWRVCEGRIKCPLDILCQCCLTRTLRCSSEAFEWGLKRSHEIHSNPAFPPFFNCWCNVQIKMITISLIISQNMQTNHVNHSHCFIDILNLSPLIYVLPQSADSTEVKLAATMCR